MTIFTFMFFIIKPGVNVTKIKILCICEEVDIGEKMTITGGNNYFRKTWTSYKLICSDLKKHIDTHTNKNISLFQNSRQNWKKIMKKVKKIP